MKQSSVCLQCEQVKFGAVQGAGTGSTKNTKLLARASVPYNKRHQSRRAPYRSK